MLIAALYVALGALLILALAARVMWIRHMSGVELGNGGNAALELAIRAHSNAAEYLPIALLMLVLLAFGQTVPWLLHLFGIVLIVARILHAFGLSRDPGLSFGRVGGIVLTVLVMLAMAIVLLVRFAMVA